MQLFKVLAVPVLAIALQGAPAATTNVRTSVNEIAVSAVQEPFSYLRCHRQAKNIVVNWGVTSTAGISYFLVLHSEDNDFFDQIAVVPVESSNKFSYKHLSVFPGYHYYKIVAVTPGGNFTSATDVVRIVSHG
jgi:hypothetical protein